ncbi:MAG: helix-turn-helix transcriptional regulator [Chloroflexota bacterium]|nr:helix-turn-helix transcriptional regulator [Chloroflexota bacterium]
MMPAQQSDCRPRGTDFPDDFPQRLERLREASGLTWRRLARELGVGVRSLYRWRTGTRPDAAHMLAIVEFATERELLDCLLTGTNEGEADERQARLFGEDVWAGLCGGGEASDGSQDIRRAA